MNMECVICIETIREKHVIECSHCGYRTCRKCTQIYLLQSHFDAHCMNCRKEWDRRFMSHHFTKQFLLNEYKHHRATILFEREKSFFPDTMVLIAEDQRRERIQNDIWRLRAQQEKIRAEIDQLYRELQPQPQPMTGEKILFVRPCVHDLCKGYVNQTSGLCGLCHQYTCLDCNTALKQGEKDSHVCDEEDKNNWEFIRRSSKPCPSCHVRIHRITGCRQMWCPQCHTAFDYVTGEIEKGIIHNPHYYQYMERLRQQGQHVPQPRHGEGCDMNFYRIQNAVATQDAVEKNQWEQFFRIVAHIRHVDLVRLRPFTRRTLSDETLSLRKDYMQNKLSDEVYKKRIQEREKRWNKNRSLYDISQCFSTMGRDLLVSLHRMDKDWEGKKQQRNQLRVFYNDSVLELNFQYQSKLSIISEEFQFTHV